MKKDAILILCFFAAINFSTAQTESQTLNFLNSKLISHGTNFLDDIRLNHSVSTVIDSLSNKKAIQISLILNDSEEGCYRFLPENVISIETERTPNGTLNLKIISPKKLISFACVDKEPIVYVREGPIILDTSDKEVQKIKKALEHLLIINGASLVDDDLFKDENMTKIDEIRERMLKSILENDNKK